MFELTRRSGGELTFPDLVRRFWDVEPSFRTWATSFQPAVVISETESSGTSSRRWRIRLRDCRQVLQATR